MFKQHTPYTIALTAVLMTGVAALADDGITLLDDSRSVTALTNLTQCPDQNAIVLSQEPQPFLPFASTVEAIQDCPDGSATARASQNSTVSATAMSAFGTALGTASSDIMGLIHAIPRSQFEISFELTLPRTFSVLGTLMSAGDSTLPVLAADSTVRLWEIGGDTIYQHTHTTETLGFFDIDETFTLEPGMYTFRAMARVHIDGGVPPSVSSAATFDLDIDIEPPDVVGDLNGDGVVDVSDLLILLGEWGECADPAACPADLNGDGMVDVSDMLILLANWS